MYISDLFTKTIYDNGVHVQVYLPGWSSLLWKLKCSVPAPGISALLGQIVKLTVDMSFHIRIVQKWKAVKKLITMIIRYGCV